MSSQQAGTTLLLVEDDDPIRLLLSMVLSCAGYQVRDAVDGFSALKSISESHPELILSDLNMPGMSGFEFLSIVRRRYPAIRVVAMSASYAGSEVPAGVAADGFHEKGSDIEGLLRLLRGVLEVGQLCRRPYSPDEEPSGIAHDAHTNSSTSHTAFTCPKCLRISAPSAEDSSSYLQGSVCRYCATVANYAADHLVDTACGEVPA